MFIIVEVLSRVIYPSSLQIWIRNEEVVFSGIVLLNFTVNSTVVFRKVVVVQGVQPPCNLSLNAVEVVWIFEMVLYSTLNLEVQESNGIKPVLYKRWILNIKIVLFFIVCIGIYPPGILVILLASIRVVKVRDPAVFVISGTLTYLEVLEVLRRNLLQIQDFVIVVRNFIAAKRAALRRKGSKKVN